MTNKNKSKAVQKKLAVKSELMKQTKEKLKSLELDPDLTMSTVSTDDTGIDVNDLMDTSLDNKDDDEDKNHKVRLAGIETISARLDDNIRKIKDLREEMMQLQAKQIGLFDGCANFFLELRDFHATNKEEEKLVQELFKELKTKVIIAFKHYFPQK